jgi:hypothetical protein
MGRSKYPAPRGLTAAESKLVEDHRGLAHEAACRFARVMAMQILRGGCTLSGFNAMYQQYFEDYVDAALIGLCVAAQRWDSTRGIKFSTYAFAYCKGYIQTMGGSEVRMGGGRGQGSMHVAMFSDCERRSLSAGAEMDKFDVWDGRDAVLEEESLDIVASDSRADVIGWLKMALSEARGGDRVARIMVRRILDGESLTAIAKDEGVSNECIRQIVLRGLKIVLTCPVVGPILKGRWDKRRQRCRRDFSGTGLAAPVA